MIYFQRCQTFCHFDSRVSGLQHTLRTLGKASLWLFVFSWPFAGLARKWGAAFNGSCNWLISLAQRLKKLSKRQLSGAWRGEVKAGVSRVVKVVEANEKFIRRVVKREREREREGEKRRGRLPTRQMPFDVSEIQFVIVANVREKKRKKFVYIK